VLCRCRLPLSLRHRNRLLQPSALRRILDSVTDTTDNAEKTRPRRFRFSLITLIVAVNVAGVLVWANVAHRKPTLLVDDEIEPAFEQGWPATASRTYSFRTMDKPETGDVGVFLGSGYRISSALTNLAVALIILITLTTSTEFLARKFRKAKRHDG